MGLIGGDRDRDRLDAGLEPDLKEARDKLMAELRAEEANFKPLEMPTLQGLQTIAEELKLPGYMCMDYDTLREAIRTEHVRLLRERGIPEEFLS